MRLILLLCTLICYGMTYPVLAGPLADRLAGELARQTPEQALPIDEVQRLDRRLIAPDALHPAWQSYPLRQLQAIYRYQQECGTDNELPAEWLPLLRALCGQGAAPSASWFAAHPIYPLGGSSAARWLAGHPAAGLDALLHVRERRDQLGQLGELGDDNLDALLRGDRWLLQSGQLWLLADGQWRRYGAGQWQPLADLLGVTLDSRTAGTCEERVGAICFNTRPTIDWQWLALASSLGFILLRERRVALQMLTHELRTPIMALPFYWLDLALDNLLCNASQHGRAPVRICASWQAGRLILAVSDGGELPGYRLATLLRRGARADGLGLGLAIVRHLLRRLGGRLTLSGPPTTFTLTLPCQLWSDPES